MSKDQCFAVHVEAIATQLRHFLARDLEKERDTGRNVDFVNVVHCQSHRARQSLKVGELESTDEQQKTTNISFGPKPCLWCDRQERLLKALDQGYQDNQRHRALYDFVAETTGELSLKAEEVIYVLQKENDDWWLAERLDRSALGWVPANYLAESTLGSEDTGVAFKTPSEIRLSHDEEGLINVKGLEKIEASIGTSVVSRDGQGPAANAESGEGGMKTDPSFEDEDDYVLVIGCAPTWQDL